MHRRSPRCGGTERRADDRADGRLRPEERSNHIHPHPSGGSEGGADYPNGVHPPRGAGKKGEQAQKKPDKITDTGQTRPLDIR
ncbi:hypothetical protein GCM10009834_17300 [Streptomonospora arabica]